MSDTHFKILIAGTVVEIISAYDCVHEFCADYFTEGDADFVVRTSEEDIRHERERDEKGTSSGRIPNDYPDSYLEVLACYRKIAEEMIDRNVLLMHGSAISIDGNGVLFVAGSGTGKSTHADIWKKKFKNRVDIINDDKPLIKIKKDAVYVCGTPWSGKKGLNSPQDVLLKAIYKLERAGDESCSTDWKFVVKKGNNSVFELDHEEKWKTLASQSYKSSNSLRLAHSMTLLDEIIKKVPVRRLVCDMSEEAALTAYEGAGFGSIT